MQIRKITTDSDYAYVETPRRGSAGKVPTNARRVRVLEVGVERDTEDRWVGYRHQPARKAERLDGVRIQYFDRDDERLTETTAVVSSRKIACTWRSYKAENGLRLAQQRQERVIRERQIAEKRLKNAELAGKLIDAGLEKGVDFNVSTYGYGEVSVKQSGIEKLVEKIPVVPFAEVA